MQSFEATTLKLRNPNARWFAVIVVPVLVLHAVYAFLLPINSDEPQHLHVVWNWTQGLLPYRDFFDNHSPVFHMLYAPMLAAIGERPDIVPLMRLGMLPLYAGSLCITWLIGRRLWGPRVALAGCALAAFYPSYFELSVQFRTDNLWALVWLASMLACISGRVGFKRGLMVGLLLGIGFAVSMKTVLLLGTAMIAALFVFVMLGISQQEWRRWLPIPALAGFAIGVLIVPGALLLWFAGQGAWDSMMYCLFGHNLVSGDGETRSSNIAKWLIGPISLPLALWLAWRSPLRRTEPRLWARRSFVLLATFGYLAVLYGYWPLFTRQGLLPVVPFLGLALATLIVSARKADAASWGGRKAWIVPILLVIECALIVKGDAKTKNIPVAKHREKLEQILAVTKPDELVMDAKGETVFRRRPIYWVLEGITLQRMRNGTIKDDISEMLVSTATKVVVDDRLPEQARAFVLGNYLSLSDNVRIAGQLLSVPTDGDRIPFAIEIEGEYELVRESGSASIQIDGSDWSGVRYLQRGEHVLESSRSGRYVLIWAAALQRGVTSSAVLSHVVRQ
jgi:4-amino-4-deoxy-L-arabinose transferase-like glycosyltransferase